VRGLSSDSMMPVVSNPSHLGISSYPQGGFAHFSGGAYTSPGRESCAQETSPMKRTLEILLTGLALAGMYCAIPKSAAPVGNTVIGNEQLVLVADGSDPMPVCRGRTCK
jgi:hypothetical protein